MSSEEEEEETNEEGGDDEGDEGDQEMGVWSVKAVHATHKWKGKRYWLVSWDGVDPDTRKAFSDSWEPQIELGANAHVFYAKYTDSNPKWTSEFSEECENILNSERGKG